LTNCPQLRVFDNVTSCLSMIGQLHQSQRWLVHWTGSLSIVLEFIKSVNKWIGENILETFPLHWLLDQVLCITSQMYQNTVSNDRMARITEM
jgi:cytochrome b subunit of formate dehydrogenase